ncbi:permease-like cell division protein FtsX [Micromonospora sp. NBC_01796]|uniref:permease-like cell division protein FtsX n=1 Tax=Micromonospora sp. NBC_01796 TaxID=2975987 RepID=UPI002DD95F08|nr:permease-like cell division protein FtsX [Micromonospora sp. NBC_01796]WSA83047.1 permease-like cell division protein FtsX [Micromonospora sp. NBC_01796]
MDQNLRLLFDRALADEPEPPGDLAGRAMATGTGLRRRRLRVMAAGMAGVAAIAALGVVNVTASPERSAPPTPVPAGFGMLMNPVCESPVRDTATDVSIFLTVDITDQQRTAVHRILDADPTVRTLTFQSREEALARYRKTFEDVPELVAAVEASQLPESFRIKLTERSRYASLASRVEREPGVDEVIGSACPVGTSVSTAD